MPITVKLSAPWTCIVRRIVLYLWKESTWLVLGQGRRVRPYFSVEALFWWDIATTKRFSRPNEWTPNGAFISVLSCLSNYRYRPRVRGPNQTAVSEGGNTSSRPRRPRCADRTWQDTQPGHLIRKLMLRPHLEDSRAPQSHKVQFHRIIREYVSKLLLLHIISLYFRSILACVSVV